MTMSMQSETANSIRSILSRPTGGVAGLVDDLLVLCRENRLQLDWQAGSCRVRFPDSNWEELPDVPLRKSVFRAILARIAALCNERGLKSVSPYGGQVHLPAGSSSPTVFKVTF